MSRGTPGGRVLSPYGRVLAVGGARRLLGSALLARLPQGMFSLAVLLLVRGATHSYAAAGIAVGTEALVIAIAAPPLGRLIDRLGRTRVLMRCALGYGAVLVALVAAAQARAGAIVLILLSGAAGALLPPIAPALRSLLPQVFTDLGVRERAYALESITQELIWITGPLLVALLITVASPAVAVLALAVAGVAGTAAFVRGPLIRSSAPPAAGAGGGTALASVGLRALLAPVALMGLALGATEVGLPALALHAGSRSSAGLLLALWSVGSMAGGLWHGARTWRSSLSARYGVLLVVAVACTAPLIAARSMAAGVICSLLAGVTIAPVFSCQYALVGHAVRPGTETEAFTWVSAALVAGIAAGSAAGGVLVSAFTFSAPFVLAVAATALAATMALVTRGLVARHSLA